MSNAEQRRRKRLAEKIGVLRTGGNPQVDLAAEVMDERLGNVPGPDVRAIFELAEAYQRQEDPDYCVISWANQERAAQFFNRHGLGDTLAEASALARDC